MISAASARAVEAAGELASAYVHVPFCARVCPYCDFTVVAGRDDVVERYLDALVREIAETPAWRPLDAVFVGGGTPSRLSSDGVGRVLAAIDRHHGLADGAEVTLEANPEDIDPVTANGFRACGVTRLSLGVQSFDDAVLADLGRSHDSDTARMAVAAAQAAGFGSVSIDLIFGSPVETDASWRRTLEAGVDLGPQHISTYSLTVEPGTVLWKNVRRGAPEPDPDVQADRWEMAAEVLGAAGYERYEVSNHARPGHHCRYNAAVWAHADYLAFGVGAHGFRDGLRTVNVRRLDTYMERVESGIGPVQHTERVEGWAAEQERLLVGLRRAAGVVPGTGGSLLVVSEPGTRLLDHGVLAVGDLGGAERLVIARPLLTDEVLRTVLRLDSPG